MAVSGDSKIEITTSQAVGIGVILVVGLFGFFQFFVGGVASDITELRGDVKEIRQSASQSVEKSFISDADLKQAIVNLDKNFAILTNDLASLVKSTDGQLQMINVSFGEMRNNWAETNNAIVSISDRLTRIEGRFQNTPYSPPPGGGGTSGGMGSGGTGNDIKIPKLNPSPFLPEPE